MDEKDLIKKAKEDDNKVVAGEATIDNEGHLEPGEAKSFALSEQEPKDMVPNPETLIPNEDGEIEVSNDITNENEKETDEMDI